MQSIIFTDTRRLAEKYRVSQQDVIDILDKNLLAREDVEFMLLDANDYQKELGKAPTWHDFKVILLDFMVGMGLQPSPSLPLFIIGGDDVIPMPRMDTPLQGAPDSVLTADLLFCFKEDQFDIIDADRAICNIGRLPMENGTMPKSLKDDLQSYFNLAGMFLDMGIDVDKVLMTSTQSWLPASNEMIKGLPVIEPKPIPEATLDNMYTSPNVDVEDKGVGKQYLKDLGKADMLLFNLHGASAQNYSSFYGEGANGHNTPEAFEIGMLQKSNARIFNTVACFGGRFIGYNRRDSMLLSSMYGGGVMLYAGSCVSALGRSGYIHDVAADILAPAGMSESFMKLYSLYLFRGVTAGEAFLRAKCDYFNTCHTLDGDDCALATILMFNLYGLPTLYVNRRDEVTTEARGLRRPMPLSKQKATYSTVFEKTENVGGILGEVRSRVNQNIELIRRTVEAKLYAYWGLSYDNLSKIEQIKQGGITKGFRFEYNESKGPLSKRSWAFTDTIGNVKDVIHLK